MNFTQADFEKLLANDEPYIPAARHRKRKPSSTLSIKEREQGLTKQLDEHRSGSKHSTQTKKPSRHQPQNADSITDIKPKLVENEAKPKRTRRRKSNAKPKADSI
ncbi:PolyA polymerase [Moraxella catarrhalis]|nr:PolyA polymerase [Moraxella catarrhalis]